MDAIKQMAEHYKESLPSGLDRIGDDERYYRGRGNICQKVNIVLSECGFKQREARLAIASALIGRRIDSTKDLLHGEALAIWRARDMVKHQLGVR